LHGFWRELAGFKVPSSSKQAFEPLHLPPDFPDIKKNNERYAKNCLTSKKKDVIC
jgi:hypothetical protein